MAGDLIVSIVADTSGDEAAATAALARAPKAQLAVAVNSLAVTGDFLDGSGGGEGVPTREGIVPNLVSNARQLSGVEKTEEISPVEASGTTHPLIEPLWTKNNVSRFRRLTTARKTLDL